MTNRARKKLDYRYFIRWARWRKQAGGRLLTTRWIIQTIPTEKRNEPFLMIYKRVKTTDGIHSVEKTRIPNPAWVKP